MTVEEVLTEAEGFAESIMQKRLFYMAPEQKEQP